MKTPRKRRSKISREFRLPANVMQEEVWEDDGPNMKLSRAFIVVLALHIVAVAGLAAFSLFDGDKTPEIGTSSKAPEKPMLPTSEPSGNRATAPTAGGPVVMEGMRAVKVDKSMSTARFAIEYDLTEEALLTMNRHTPLLQGTLASGQTVYVPDTAVRRSPQEDSPVAPAAEAPGGATDRRPAESTLPVVEADPGPAVVQPHPRTDGTTMPPPRPIVPATPRNPATTGDPTTTGLTHKLAPGENLYRIHRKYNVSVEALKRANGITDPSKIRAGTILKIPK